MKKYLILFICFISLKLYAQSLLESANEKFNNQNWEGAIKEYSKYLKKNETDSAAWYNLAYSESQIEKYDDAIKHFQEARKRNFNRTYVDYSIVKNHALKGDSDGMYAALEEAANNGLFAFQRLKTDPAFAEYQQQDQFTSLLEKVKSNAFPCLNEPDNRHFDFWIGEWDVYVNGQKVGENTITRAEGGCAIHENYITPGIYSGQSINFYSPVDEKWHQHWVGSAGDVYNYVETMREEGLLQFVSEFKTRQGTISLSRLTFTANEDGTVRQLFENSSDGGKTWTSGFDGLYKRKE